MNALRSRPCASDQGRQVYVGAHVFRENAAVSLFKRNCLGT
jgi:hypothetical protein